MNFSKRYTTFTLEHWLKSRVGVIGRVTILTIWILVQELRLENWNSFLSRTTALIPRLFSKRDLNIVLTTGFRWSILRRGKPSPLIINI